MSLFCYALLSVHYSFANIFKRKRKVVALLFIVLHMYCYYKCSVALPHSATGCSAVIVVSSHIVTVGTPETSKPPYSYLYRKIGPSSIETS